MISRLVSVGDRDGTGTVGMAVSNKLKLGFVVARVGKRQAYKSGQAVRHTADFRLLHNGDIHIVDFELCLCPGCICVSCACAQLAKGQN